MRIALLGYGKMGKEIEKISIERGHSISIIKDKNDTVSSIDNVDVAINFSTPDSAVDNIKLALNSSVPIICGTTGWLDDYEKIVEFSKKTNTSFLYSSNYSLGVNLFFDLNKKLAKLISSHKDYELKISETHHTEKLDKPSGTAITIAEDIINNSKYLSWTFEKNNTSEIEDNDYIKKISDLILNKSKAIKEEDIFKRKSKIARFLYQKGFETELIWQQIEKNLKND